MQIIEKLQRSRPEVVHLFDELVRTIPDGTYLTALEQNKARLKIQGVAQSSTRVSTFMRNIDDSEWLRNPELEVIETKSGQTLGANFTLFADQVSTLAEDEAAAAAAAAAKQEKGKKGKKADKKQRTAKSGDSKSGGES
jgi:type IV pilus assembly protein PilN